MLPEKSVVLTITLAVGLGTDQRHGSVMVRVPRSTGKPQIACLARQLAEEHFDVVDWQDALVNGTRCLRSFQVESVPGVPDSGAVVECELYPDGTWMIEA
jgi:hypothetical protein